MPYKKEDISALKSFLPDNCFDTVFEFLNHYKIALTITKQRKHLLGTYTYDPRKQINEITVNGNLNAYNFLITLLHEIAHCITYNAHKRSVKPHGNEWKKNYSLLLKSFIEKNIFPEDIVHALQKQIKNPNAGCTDLSLEKTLHKYDHGATLKTYVSDLSIGSTFTTKNKSFLILEKRRTRYLCEDISTKQQFLFPSGYVVDSPQN